MLYFDAELEQSELKMVAQHVATCPKCQGELMGFQSLDHMIHRVQEVEALSRDESRAYYSCVCRKLTEKQPWAAVYWLAFGVMAVGSLLLFTLPATPLYQTMGLLALLMAGGIIWLGQYCRCRG